MTLLPSEQNMAGTTEIFLSHSTIECSDNQQNSCDKEISGGPATHFPAEHFPKGENVAHRSASHALKDRKKKTACTMKWLEENYCASADVCLPRIVVYEHYLDFCRKEKIVPACKATFGKLVRSKFPHVTSKRLGARGHSKYHYNGIGVKHSSKYYYSSTTSGGLTRFSGCKLKNEGGYTRKFALSSKVGTLLPSFPEVSDLNIPMTLDKAKLEIFLTMYRTHCQCILDTAITGNFEEICSFLLHFWHGLPEHLTPLVHQSQVVDIIAACDLILYKTLTDILIPSTMQQMPETLLCGIRNMAHNWEGWLRSSLENLPESLTKTKMTVARTFSRSLRRQVSFLHIAQVVRPVLYDAEAVESMAADMDSIDLQLLQSLCITAIPKLEGEIEILNSLKEQLRKQPTVEGFIEWLDFTVEKNLMQAKSDNERNLQSRAQDFLLTWTFVMSRFSQVLTISSSENFASFHVLSLLLQEYLFLAIEGRLDLSVELDVHKKFKPHLKKSGFYPQDLYEKPSSCFLVNRKKMRMTDSSKDSSRGTQDHMKADNEVRSMSSQCKVTQQSASNKERKNVAIVTPMEHSMNHDIYESGTQVNHSYNRGTVQNRPITYFWQYDPREELINTGNHNMNTTNNIVDTAFPGPCYLPSCQEINNQNFADKSSCYINASAAFMNSFSPQIQGTNRCCQYSFGNQNSAQPQIPCNRFVEKYCLTEMPGSTTLTGMCTPDQAFFQTSDVQNYQQGEDCYTYHQHTYTQPSSDFSFFGAPFAMDNI